MGRRTFRLTCAMLAFQWLAVAGAMAFPQDGTARLREWVAACEKVEGVRAEWLVMMPITDGRDGPVISEIQTDWEFRYRWPDAMIRVPRVQREIGRSGEPLAAFAVAVTQETVRVMGGEREAKVYSGEPNCQMHSTRLADSRMIAAEIPNAPFLLGRWIAEQPDGAVRVESDSGTEATYFVPEMNWRFSLRGESAGEMAVSRFSLVDADGGVLLAYDFSEFRAVAGYPGEIGYLRSYVGRRFNGEMSQPVTHMLLEFRVERAIPDSAFAYPSVEAMREVAMKLAGENGSLLVAAAVPVAAPRGAGWWPWIGLSVLAVGIGGVVVWRLGRERVVG